MIELNKLTSLIELKQQEIVRLKQYFDKPKKETIERLLKEIEELKKKKDA